MWKFKIIVKTPVKSQYAGQELPLDVEFPEDYPESPLNVNMYSLVEFGNKHVTEDGEVTLPILHD